MKGHNRFMCTTSLLSLSVTLGVKEEESLEGVSNHACRSHRSLPSCTRNSSPLIFVTQTKHVIEVTRVFLFYVYGYVRPFMVNTLTPLG